MYNYWYDKESKTMFVYKTITVKEFLQLKKKYGKVVVVAKKVRW